MFWAATRGSRMCTDSRSCTLWTCGRYHEQMCLYCTFTEASHVPDLLGSEDIAGRKELP